MKRMKRALTLILMTCNHVSIFNVVCECGKVQKDIGFKCTCRILVCTYTKNLKYMVFINVSIIN